MADMGMPGAAGLFSPKETGKAASDIRTDTCLFLQKTVNLLLNHQPVFLRVGGIVLL